MKRYLLFISIEYQDRHQGWNGFRGDFDSLEDAKFVLQSLDNNSGTDEDYFDHWHIVDTKDKEIIARGIWAMGEGQ